MVNNQNETNKSKIADQEKENAPNRKRKATDSQCGPASQKAKTKWSADGDACPYIYKDYKELGVGPLVDTSLDGSSNSCPAKGMEKTPAITVLDCTQVPDAPRIMVTSHLENHATNKSPKKNQTNKYVFLKGDDDFIKRRKKVPEISKNNIVENLPDIVLLNIFKYLPKVVLAKCARVCKKWHRISESESLWKRLDLGCKSLSEGILGQILNRGVTILRLSRAQISSPIYTGIRSVFSSTKLSKLQYLDLGMCSVSVQGLEEILSKCHDLRKLNLESCEVNDTICSYIAENKELEVLNMCMVHGITDNGLMPIASNCRKLVSLNIGWTGLKQHSIMYLSLCLPESIHKLNLSGFRESMTDEEVSQLVRTCPRLVNLDLSDSTVITEKSVHLIIYHLKNLEYLSLARCNRILPVSLYSLCNLPYLSQLNLYGMLPEDMLQHLCEALECIVINKSYFSKIARPTVGIHRTSIWGLRVRDNPL